MDPPVGNNINLNKSVVRVGVGVLVQDPNDPSKVFCGIRKGSHGAGLLALPGGHLEMYETWDACAKREILEETGLELDDDTLRFAHCTNDPMPSEGKHYITIFMMAKCRVTNPPQQAKTMEPEKCKGWKSYTWRELEELHGQGQLFGPLHHLVEENPASVLEFLKSS